MSELIAELKKVMNSKKRKTLIFMLIEVLKYKLQSNITEFYNIIGDLLYANYNYFLNNCYFYLKNKASKILTPDKLFEMDKYILENFCFGDIEKLLISFKGEFYQRNAKVIGHIYLTNLRFLADGKVTEKSSSSSLRGPKRIYELPFYLAAAAMRSARQSQRLALKKALQESMGQNFTENALNIFKSHFPIKNAYDIKKPNYDLNLQYLIKLEYQDKEQIKAKEVKFRITPKIEKKEKNNDFIIRRKRIFSIIEETLYSNQ